MKPDIKKIIITNLPYLLFVYLFGKLSEAWRLAAGADASQKLVHLLDSLAVAFANGLPSFHPFDLCIGIAGAVLVRLAVYLKGKNAKKYRHGMEYSNAR
ncbi:conjugal transfer protein TraG [Pseudoflavonifractor sp. 524-17]|nr:conjugal transfer protein TraG [Pseudoflavonifractor sp. 524-17]